MIFFLWLNLVLDIAGVNGPKAASSSRLSVFSGLGLGRLREQLMGRRTDNNSRLSLVHSQNVHLPKVDNFLLPANLCVCFSFRSSTVLFLPSTYSLDSHTTTTSIAVACMNFTHGTYLYIEYVILAFSQ